MVADPAKASAHCGLRSSSSSLAMFVAMRAWGFGCPLLCSSDAHDGNSHDAQKRAEHGTEYEYGGEHQQES